MRKKGRQQGSGTSCSMLLVQVFTGSYTFLQVLRYASQPGLGVTFRATLADKKYRYANDNL